MLRWGISVLVKMLDKTIFGRCRLEGGHIYAFSDFDQYRTIVDLQVGTVPFYAFGDVFDWDVHTLVSVHRSVEVEILDVDCHESCIFGGDDTVEEDFYCCTVSGGNANFAFVIDAVALDGETHPFFLYFVGLASSNDASVVGRGRMFFRSGGCNGWCWFRWACEAGLLVLEGRFNWMLHRSTLVRRVVT